MVGDAWEQVQDGFARGPVLRIETERGESVVCSALWTEVDGVCLGLEVGDEVLSTSEAVTLAAVLLRLARMPAPGDSSG